MNPLPVETRRETADDTPADGYGPGFLVYQIASHFHALCCLVGLDNAQDEVAEIILSERSRKRRDA